MVERRARGRRAVWLARVRRMRFGIAGAGLAILSGTAPGSSAAAVSAHAPGAAGVGNSAPVGEAPDGQSAGQYTVYVYPEGHRGADREAGSKEIRDRQALEREIRETLSAWAAAAGNNNVERESAFYAPAVSRYFLVRNVSNSFVRRDKAALRERGSRLQSFRIEDVSVNLVSPAEANVFLTKSWVMARASGTRAGSTRSRLWLSRTPQGWKITGEQDLKPAGAEQAQSSGAGV